jgi:hypothetical protein
LSAYRFAGRQVRLPLVCAAVALILSGCSGGGGGSDPVTCTNLSFDRALTTPAVNDVYLDQAAGTCSTIGIAVLVDGLSGIWSVSFDISYPASLLAYQSYTLGPLLQKGAPLNAPVVVVHTSGNDVQVTMSRLGSDPPVGATGSESLITLSFARLAAGSAAIDFDTSGASTVGEIVLDDNSPPTVRPAVFGPGHGGMVVIP